MEPPSERGEGFCDAATKTHINDTPAYYYSYAIATVFKFQLHDYIARRILKQPPQACNYADNKEVGAFLQNMMAKGATEDWRKVLKDATGEELSTRAMMEYFKPLMAWAGNGKQRPADRLGLITGRHGLKSAESRVVPQSRSPASD
ncbi:MAG: M2 family metallopeptidase [Chthoniobacterales bacterium]|nr:M2 family metallopeptidase [Chthoniobacterales bacterium]